MDDIKDKLNTFIDLCKKTQTTGETFKYLVLAFNHIVELEQRLAAAESAKLRLRGQLQHCIQKLSHANRDARDRNEYTDAIDSANRAIYEIFECPVKEHSGSEGE